MLLQYSTNKMHNIAVLYSIVHFVGIVIDCKLMHRNEYHKIYRMFC
jgi:hypothetical protein